MSQDSDVLESGIYSGMVHHLRTVPKIHRFNYNIFLYWLKLSELPQLETQVKGFNVEQKKWSMVNFCRADYLGDSALSLQDSVLGRMNELQKPVSGEQITPRLTGDVFMLGQVRTFGLYFSPVNFYYLRNAHGVFSHMLAEVSNTPWNKRHHYLVDLAQQNDSQKAFHVSPFNPMDMVYKWNIKIPDEHLRLRLSCYQQEKHFEASLDMQKVPLNSATLRKALFSIPSMTIKTVIGIYWQAIKLFFKRVPIYTHS